MAMVGGMKVHGDGEAVEGPEPPLWAGSLRLIALIYAESKQKNENKQGWVSGGERVDVRRTEMFRNNA
jgi:hypothetical protein